jgi:hypothetical protein
MILEPTARKRDIEKSVPVGPVASKLMTDPLSKLRTCIPFVLSGTAYMDFLSQVKCHGKGCSIRSSGSEHTNVSITPYGLRFWLWHANFPSLILILNTVA